MHIKVTKKATSTSASTLRELSNRNTLFFAKTVENSKKRLVCMGEWSHHHLRFTQKSRPICIQNTKNPETGFFFPICGAIKNTNEKKKSFFIKLSKGFCPAIFRFVSVRSKLNESSRGNFRLPREKFPVPSDPKKSFVSKFPISWQWRHLPKTDQRLLLKNEKLRGILENDLWLWRQKSLKVAELFWLYLSVFFQKPSPNGVFKYILKIDNNKSWNDFFLLNFEESDGRLRHCDEIWNICFEMLWFRDKWCHSFKIVAKSVHFNYFVNNEKFFKLQKYI